MENFGSIDSFPQSMTEAKNKYDDKFCLKWNVTWHIQDMMEKLTQAFKEKRKSEILFIAADLGHYIADAHMPLHTSDNHDGQLTDQRNSLWGRLPNYLLRLQTRPRYEDVNKATWDLIMDTTQFSGAALSCR
jgi:hypothetical protein